MRAQNTTIGVRKGASRIYDRILGNVEGERDDALVFAVASVVREITDPRNSGVAAIREVTTEAGVYSVCGSIVYTAGDQQSVVVVHARQRLSTQDVEDRIRERYHLTRKEARVALLLAEQKSNEEIAEDLFISSHTARHHTQSVLNKLGVRSRREIAGLLTPQ
jgi:DNA-binding CsgD family transcriptional regulator